MTIKLMIAGLALTLGLAGCSAFEPVTRNAPIETGGFGTFGQQIVRDYQVHGMTFLTPTDLEISESNGFYPIGDIVWRGDPVGNRIEQIGKLFETAVERNETAMDGQIPIVIDVELVRFHGVSERTRFTTGGVYNIVFDLTLRHAVTGDVVEDRHRVLADLAAPGGYAALLLEQRGQTEKVRVTDFLTQVMRDELTGRYDI